VRDNQPKHRQLRRTGRRLERKKASRAGLPAILIICEGRQTEPNYLRGLCEEHGINRANVTIVSGDGETDAVRLVQKAQRRFEIDRDFDAVFVVCDCVDDTLVDAKARAARSMKNVSGEFLAVELIVSSPCFEFWLLLHFEYVTRPFQTAEAVVDALRRHVTDYDKADRLIFAKVAAGLDRALGNAARLKAELTAVGAVSPDTDMPKLVARLTALRR
jgi:RloB-like protein